MWLPAREVLFCDCDPACVFQSSTRRLRRTILILRDQSLKLGSVTSQSHMILNSRQKYEEEWKLVG